MLATQRLNTIKMLTTIFEKSNYGLAYRTNSLSKRIRAFYFVIRDTDKKFKF